MSTFSNLTMADAQQVVSACQETNERKDCIDKSLHHDHSSNNTEPTGSQIPTLPSLQEAVGDAVLQLSRDDHHQLSYAEFFQNHLSDSGSVSHPLASSLSPQNPTNITGKEKNCGFFQEANDLQMEAKSLQMSLEKAAESLASIEPRSLLTKTNKGTRDPNPKHGHEEKIAEVHTIIAELTGKLRGHNNPAVPEGSRTFEASSESSSSLGSEHSQNEQLETQVCNLKQLMKQKDVEIEELHTALSALSCELERSKHQRCDVKTASSNQVPVLKVAERIKLKTMDKPVTGYLISNLGVSRTEVAEHLVSDLTENCDIQELKEKHELEVELERLNSKLEHIRSQNALLQLNFDESKAHSSRLSILIGKYESNIIALKQALDKSDEIAEIYRTLRDAKKSPKRDEKLLLNKLSKLLQEQNSIKSTVVKLESHITEPLANPVSITEARKLDIETAVLMQELMAMREEKAELKAQLFCAEKEREQLELKLFSQQLQYQALAQSGTEGCDRGDSTEIRLKERLKEMALGLDRVTRNAELKQRQLGERVSQLKTVNSVLAHSLEKCNQKLQTRVRKVETQMLSMAERHAGQVGSLKQNISLLEDKVTCYENNIRVLENELKAWRRPCS